MSVPDLKLTLVSVVVHGQAKTFFITLPLVNGKPVMDRETLEAGIPVGTTYTLG